MAAQSSFVCQLCDQKNVQWKCEECGIFICSTCREKIHPRLKSSDTHRIVSIKDIWKNSEPWYHGTITGIEANRILRKYKFMGDGAFLVRESGTCIGNYTFSFIVKGEVIHSRIQTKEETGQLKYQINETLFDSLYDVIQFLKIGTHDCMVDGKCEKFRLTTPVPKETKNDK